MPHEVRLKRKNTEVIKIKVNGAKFIFQSGSELMAPTETVKTIKAVISIMNREGLKRFRIEEEE